MKFNPTTKILLTNDGVLIKKLHCPHGVQWDLLFKESTKNRFCELCRKNIVDICNMDDEKIIKAVKKEPNICLRVDMYNSNIRVVNHNDSSTKTNK